MLKKVLTVWIIIMVFTLTGCSQETNSQETKIENEEISKELTIVNQTAQKKVNEMKNSAVPNFEEIYKNTVEIDVNFDSEGMFRTYKAKIADNKMLSDILTMIGKSQLIKDESKIKKMSGMATKNNSLILVAGNGSKKEIKFAFDDPAFAVGYLEIDDQKYDPGFSFFRYIKDFTEYRQFDPNIDNQVEELFKKYNWTIDYRVNTMNETLPSNLKHDAGEYPVKIYWAYNNELSKNIGLDYSEYLGKEVEVDIYRLREPLPDYMNPRMNSRGIVLQYNNKIVGAYIDAGRHDCFACSLDRKSLTDITNNEWDHWISDYINYNNELEIELSKMKPEDIIKQYYKAINSHDQKMQFACLTRQNLCNYLSTNMDNNLLMNAGYNNVYMDGEQNVKSAKFISSREISGLGNPKGAVEYAATVDFKFKKEITSNSGKQPRFIILKKESDKSGWRIDSEGTGP
ncbi:DUF4829 domain-containing protein [Desulfosporosinus sp. BG]|uniref:DUF4829 domain-containing protein n=1 Tax=Desulfosporosinus sp. BG TaxID=1633135 RepID=UPI00083B4187|nr:DUF4829 domain-containing protein [Desulfosporosinus sp. BG]ODA41642.1 hypothetical protein DSBG_1571 [Desulfosporosinus sp. BG]